MTKHMKLFAVLVALAGPAVASAQCVACNVIQEDCSWGPWINGYDQCLTVDGNCVQSDPCGPAALRSDLDGRVLPEPSPKTLNLASTVASLSHGSLSDASFNPLELTKNTKTAERNCRGYVIASVYRDRRQEVKAATRIRQIVL